MDTKNEYRVTHIYKQPDPPSGQEPETPHIAVLKNNQGFTLVYLVEDTLLSDLHIDDIIKFEHEKPHLGINSAKGTSSDKELYFGMFAESLSENEVKASHLPSFPN
jgi:hypothetical protein